MTPEQKELIRLFLSEKWQVYQTTGGSFENWLVDFIILTKAQQYSVIKTWLSERKTANTALLNSLEAQKLANENRINLENAIIDNLSSSI